MYLLLHKGVVRYVGKACDPKQRLRFHKWARGKRDLHLVVVSRHNSEVTALRAERALMQRLEAEGVVLWNSMRPSTVSGLSHSLKTRRLLSKRATGMQQGAATRKRRSRSLLGRVFSEEHRAKLSRAASKRRWSKAARKRLSEAHLGYKHTKKTKLKLRRLALVQWERQRRH